MERLKVMKKEDVLELMKNKSYKVRYYDIYGEVRVVDNEDKIVGSMRFESFLKITKGMNKKQYLLYEEYSA